jgi:hypothetical protein
MVWPQKEVRAELYCLRPGECLFSSVGRTGLSPKLPNISSLHFLNTTVAATLVVGPGRNFMASMPEGPQKFATMLLYGAILGERSRLALSLRT